jgi:hypothetical protein
MTVIQYHVNGEAQRLPVAIEHPGEAANRAFLFCEVNSHPGNPQYDRLQGLRDILLFELCVWLDDQPGIARSGVDP